MMSIQDFQTGGEPLPYPELLGDYDT
jgi:hypothetical protein